MNKKLSLKRIIQYDILTITIITSVLIYVFCVYMIYYTGWTSAKTELKRETISLMAKLNDDPDYLENIHFFEDAHITLIAENGDVLFDVDQNPDHMSNKLNDPQIIEASKKGVSEATEKYGGFLMETFIYTVKLENGSFLMTSSSLNSLVGVIIPSIAVLSAVLILSIAISYIISSKLTRNLVDPINDLNLSDPLSNNTFTELRPLLESMEMKNQIRREFSANVSHELKTPLTTIIGCAELISNGMVSNEDLPRFNEKIMNEGRILVDKIDDIITLSLIEESDDEIELEEINFRDLIEEILDRLKLKIQSKKLQVKTILLNVEAKSNYPILEEVLFNLIDNAIKYNVDGGILRVRLHMDNDYVYVDVKDSGIGISMQDQERIFERFYRADQSHNGSIEGSGLGLAIVKHGVQRLGGEIRVESEVKQGSVFYVKFKR